MDCELKQNQNKAFDSVSTNFSLFCLTNHQLEVPFSSMNHHVIARFPLYSVELSLKLLSDKDLKPIDKFSSVLLVSFEETEPKIRSK
jgi:hypothetical protein